MMAIVRKPSSLPKFGTGATPRWSVEEVRDFARAHGIPMMPLDVHALAIKLGIRIVKEPMESHISGYLKHESGFWKIALNSLHHPRRQNFTLAHELGHYFLHSHKSSSFVDQVLFRDDERNPMEWDANRFAGALLMPEREFQAAIEKGVRKIDDLADHFGVSSLAVRVRAKELGFQGHGL